MEEIIMEQKQNRIINAYKIIENLNRTNFDSITAYRMFKLKKQLKEFYDWQQERETELFKKYGASFSEDGSIRLSDNSQAENFVAEINEMSELVHEIEPVEIVLSAFDSLSIEQIETLDGFIDFIEG